MEGKRLALYGGTFDPVHVGHLNVAHNVRRALGLDLVVFVPSSRPPHKFSRRLTPFRCRAEMVELAIAGEPGLGCDRCEEQRTGPSYSLQTVRDYQARFPELRELCWIIGADSLSELCTWHRVAELVASCRIVTAARPGWEAPDLTALQEVVGSAAVHAIHRDILATPTCAAASRDVRARLAAGQSIQGLVPERVCRYIEEHGLYQA